MQSDTVRLVTYAYIVHGGFNIVALDWAALSSGLYRTAVANVFPLADRLADVLIDLNAAGLSPSKVHLVGHSLGGQMCGLIGNGLQKKSKNTLIVDRVTGLDPAGPLFYNNLHIVSDDVREMTPKDAVFVDVIHTDAGFLGDVNSCGQIDFWPNSGTRFAPDCPVGSIANCK